jgi:hypothetical protein
VTTVKGDTVFVHLLDWPGSDPLWIPLARPVRAARYLKDGSRAGVRPFDRGVLLEAVPDRARDPFDTVVALELEPEK